VHAIAATDNVIMLQIINNSDLAKINSMSTKLNGGLSISKNYKHLARNSTSMISGKTFNVITVECPFSSLMGSQGAAATTSIQSNFGNRSNNNILSLMSKSIIANGMMQTKPFEYNGSDRTYKLAIVVCNQLFLVILIIHPKTTRHNKIYQIHKFNSKYIEIRIRQRPHFFLSPKIFQQQHNQQIDSFLIHFCKAVRN
jgi:hypothetical protein